MSNELRVRATLQDEATKPVKDLRGAFEALKGPAGAAGVVMGVSAAAAASAFGLVDEAVSKTVDFLGESVKAAMEEQVSTDRMTAALKANVAGWDGNTSAIDDRIQAGMRLAFSDDDIRDSFTKLVAATHDVNKAFEVQHVAMDLARFKGISLADASDALVKVEAGQYRALKQLGIVLKDGATQTEALAAVEKVAAGQAAAYADTVSGKTEQLQHRFEQLQQKIGGAVIPTLDRAAGGLVDLADATDGGADAADKFQRGILQLDAAITGVIMPNSAMAKGFQQSADAIDRLDRVAAEAQGVIDKNVAALNEWRDAQMRAKAAFQDGDKAQAVANFRAIAAAEQHAADVAAGFAKTTRDTTKTVLDKWHDLESAAKTLADDLATAGRDAADALYGPIEDRAHLNDVKGQIAQVYAKAKAEHRSLTNSERGDLASLRADLLETQVKLAGEGKLTKAELSKLIDQLQAQSQKAAGATKAYIDELIQKLLALRKVAKTTASSLETLQLNTGKGTGPKPTAKGGRRDAGELLLVGEEGPELWRPDSAGTMIPNDRLRSLAAAATPVAASAGGRDGAVRVDHYVHLDGGTAMTPGERRQIGEALGSVITAWQQRNGVLPRAGSPMAG